MAEYPTKLRLLAFFLIKDLPFLHFFHTGGKKYSLEAVDSAHSVLFHFSRRNFVSKLTSLIQSRKIVRSRLFGHFFAKTIYRKKTLLDRTFAINQ